MSDDLRVILELVHADVLDAGTDRRDPLGSHENEHIAVKEVILIHHIDLRHRIVIPRIGDLVLLELPTGGHLVRDITNSDGGDHISAEKVQTC